MTAALKPRISGHEITSANLYTAAPMSASIPVKEDTSAPVVRQGGGQL
jgi:hypothetical protein